MLRLHAAGTAVSSVEIGLHVRQAGFCPARHEDPLTRKEKLSIEVGNPPFVGLCVDPLHQQTQISLRRFIVLPPARLYHFYDVKMRMRLRNLGKGVTAVPELTEEKAVELGSQLAAEMVFMGVASAIAYRDKVARTPHDIDQQM